MLPFRLVGVFPSEREIWEWRWDSTELEAHAHEWKSRHWFSSSLSDERAERLRGMACRHAQVEHDAGSAQWLRRLHASHVSGPGPFSLCVHRAEVKTMSYSEIVVTARAGSDGHFRGSPCTMGEIHPIAVERVVPRLRFLGYLPLREIEYHVYRHKNYALARTDLLFIAWNTAIAIDAESRVVEASAAVGVLASLFVLSPGGGVRRLSRHQVSQFDSVYGGESCDPGGRIRGRVET